MKDFDRERTRLLREMEACADFTRGSVTGVCAACNRARCICGKKSRRKACRLTYKDSNQRTGIVYVPRDRLPAIRRMIANYSRLRRLIERLVETNIAAFKVGSGS